MAFLTAIWTFLVAHGPFIISAISAVIAFLQANHVAIPAWVLTILAAFGIGTVHAAMAYHTNKVKESVKENMSLMSQRRL